MMKRIIRRWMAKPRNEPNPYVCRSLRRIEYLGLWLIGKNPRWSNGGHLVIGNGEFSTIFPRWMYAFAAKLQNRHPWMRLFLSF